MKDPNSRDADARRRAIVALADGDELLTLKEIAARVGATPERVRQLLWDCDRGGYTTRRRNLLKERRGIPPQYPLPRPATYEDLRTGDLVVDTYTRLPSPQWLAAWVGFDGRQVLFLPVVGKDWARVLTAHYRPGAIHSGSDADLKDVADALGLADPRRSLRRAIPSDPVGPFVVKDQRVFRPPPSGHLGLYRMVTDHSVERGDLHLRATCPATDRTLETYGRSYPVPKSRAIWYGRDWRFGGHSLVDGQDEIPLHQRDLSRRNAVGFRPIRNGPH